MGRPWSPPTHLLCRLPLLLELEAAVPQLVHHALVQVHLILEPQAGVLQPAPTCAAALQPGDRGRGRVPRGPAPWGLCWGPGGSHLDKQANRPARRTEPPRHELKKTARPLILELQ